eukprot:1571374-Rhodomonas_salina.1
MAQTEPYGEYYRGSEWNSGRVVLTQPSRTAGVSGTNRRAVQMEPYDQEIRSLKEQLQRIPAVEGQNRKLAGLLTALNRF